jgi:hypothetical protein
MLFTANDSTAAHGMITGFMAIVALWVWVGAVLLYALFRSTARSDPDPIRPSGPGV